MIRRELGINKNDYVVLFAARFTKRKRPEDLLAAIKEINNNDISVLFVGDGVERDRIEEYSKKNNIKAVFTGYKNQLHISKYYSIADLCVIISDYDPSPKAMNEAMNFSLPIIATDVIGTSGDLVVDGENGYVISVGDVKSLSEKISYLSMNRDVSKKFGERSCEIIKDWTFEKDASYICKAINEVMK